MSMALWWCGIIMRRSRAPVARSSAPSPSPDASCPSPASSAGSPSGCRVATLRRVPSRHGPSRRGSQRAEVHPEPARRKRRCHDEARARSRGARLIAWLPSGGSAPRTPARAHALGHAADPLAVVGASRANVGAGGAGMPMGVRSRQHDVGRRPAHLGAGRHQAKVLGFGVVSAGLEAVMHGGREACSVAGEAGVDAGLHVLRMRGHGFAFETEIMDAGRRTRLRAHRQRSSDAPAPSRRRQRHRDGSPLPGLVRHRRADRHRPAVEGLVHRQEGTAGRQCATQQLAVVPLCPGGELFSKGCRVRTTAMRRAFDRVGMCGP